MSRSLAGVVSILGVAAFVAASGAKDKTPVSAGEYQFRIGDQRIGQEQFRVYEDKGYKIESTRTMYWPEPARYEYRYELERSLEPKKLTIQATRGGILTELKVERKGKRWRAEVKGQGRKKRKHELGSREGTILDFDSLLFNSLALKRMRMAPEQHMGIDVITLQLPDFMGMRTEHTYRRLEDEEVETELLGKVQASRYELEVPAGKHELWVDPSGLVLKAELDHPAGEIVVELVRHKSSSSTWP